VAPPDRNGDAAADPTRPLDEPTGGGPATDETAPQPIAEPQAHELTRGPTVGPSTTEESRTPGPTDGPPETGAAEGPASELVDTPVGGLPAAGVRGKEARPLSRHPLVRAGVIAWSGVGLALASLGLLFVLGQIRLVVVPLVLALFPAALLAPVQEQLRRAKVPAALAALIVLLGGIGLLALVVVVLIPQVADELPRLTQQVQSGLDQLQAFLDSGPLGLDPQVIRDVIDDAQQAIAESDVLRTGVLGAAGAVAEMTTMLLLLLVVLFFYLKDGDRIAAWLRSLFPVTAQPHVGAVGTRAWVTVGAYFRGQLFVAFVDGLFIGIGLFIIGVPLALPLGVLVFFGGLFPIVGAVASGAVAILVALASGGPSMALMTLGIVLAVQQLESNILAPLVLGKATALHPLAVITVLTIGGILLGMLGAFLAVPIAASAARAVGYLRERRDGAPPTDADAAAAVEAATSV
jgi:putative heme transporter